MNLLQIANLFPKEASPLNWGEGNSLWSIARNKLIGLSTLEVYLSQCLDNELKLLIDLGIKDLAVPQIERITQFLHSLESESPGMLGRSTLKEIGKNTGQVNFLKDNEIATSMREIMRLAMYLSVRGLDTSYRNDVLDLIWGILQEDFQAFRQIIAMQKKKNWLMAPPAVLNTRSNQEMNWGEAIGLWSIGRNKLVTISLFEIYLSQAKHPELRSYIEETLKKTVIPILERVDRLLHKEGHGLPSMFGRTSLEAIGRKTGNYNWLKENEIAVFLREQMRLTLYVDFESLVDTVRNDLLDCIWEIFTGDVQRFRQIINLQRKNNWLLGSPGLTMQ